MAREFMRAIAQAKWDRIRVIFPDLELIAALLLLAAGLYLLGPRFGGMAKSSLWQDELHSIERYSSKGPVFTLTNYQEPNNITWFFNLLNSLTPGKEPFHPLRARFWSFVFVALMVVVSLLSHAVDRIRPIWMGPPSAFLLLANISNLDLLLQARGYGLLAFAALPGHAL